MMGDLGDPSTSSACSCGLYVHIPFCEAKCGYCDFYSIAIKSADPTPVLRRVEREITARTANGDRRIPTIFCGGGTPTILSTSELKPLLQALLQAVPAQGLVEFTVEANPATVDDEKAKLLVDAGVTRVSMGAQSFFKKELAVLERLHAPQDIEPSVRTLRRNGLRQVNLDLIFGVPGQTMDTWSQSLQRTIDLNVDHIACYSLTYEPSTRLTTRRDRGRLTPCDEELEAQMYLLAVDMLGEAGYRQYEISNFARPGCCCRHNLIYWRNGPYIGVGPSAAGCVAGRRYKNIADVSGYIRLMDERGHAEVESETLDTQMVMTEMIMMQLRLVEGLSIAAFRQRTGVDPLVLLDDALKRLTSLGFIFVSDTHIALTRNGRLVADAVMAELVCACDHRWKSSLIAGRPRALR